MKVLENLGNGIFKVEIKKEESDYRNCGFSINHDYISFSGNHYSQNPDGSTNFDAVIDAKVNIPIKAFIEIVLPKLLESEYCSPEHLEDRIYTEDDITWNSKFNNGKYNKPRYKKGDKYPAYSYMDTCVKYWDNEKKCMMVAICLSGEKHFSHITYDLYKKLTKKE